MLAAILGVLKAGTAYVPLDPAFPADRLTYMLEDSRASLVVSQSSLRASLPQSAMTSCAWTIGPPADGSDANLAEVFVQKISRTSFTPRVTGRRRVWASHNWDC